MSFFLSLLGIALALLSIVLTYLTFFNPIWSLKYALSKPQSWRKARGFPDSIDQYYHKFWSGFSLRVNWDKPVNARFQLVEPWAKNLHSPDFSTNASYYVEIYFNGMKLDAELFLSFDGGRNFVPIPKRRRYAECFYDKTEFTWPEFWITERQIQIAKIVGNLYLAETPEEFWGNNPHVRVRESSRFVFFRKALGTISLAQLPQDDELL